MGMAFTYQGASGARYEFLLFDIANPKALPWHGGLFAFATYTPDPLFFGQGINLCDAITTCPAWPRADARHGTVVYLMIEDDAKKRSIALADLLANYDAPLNKAVTAPAA